MGPAYGAGATRLVYTLSVDLIGSTLGSIGMTQRETDRFNRAIVAQIEPHLEALAFDDLVAKFTGDGWTLMSPELHDAERFAALAAIMRAGFQSDLAHRTGLPLARIPSLRMAICTGRDIAVEMWQGSRDWVGDSARRAARSAGFCYPNEVLVDGAVHSVVMRDFVTNQIDPGVRPTRPKRVEEEIPLWSLGELRIEAAADWDIPAAYVYALDQLGRADDAAEASRRAATGIHGDEAGSIHRWNRLILAAPTHRVVLELWDRMLAAGAEPDTATLNALISRSPGYSEARKWADLLIERGVQPDIVTFNELIARTGDWAQALEVVGELTARRIAPTEATAATLIFRAPSFRAAVALLDELHAMGVQPTVAIFRRLIAKAPGYERAVSVLDLMSEWRVAPDRGVFNALIALAPSADEASAWLGRMEAAAVAPDASTINTLIARAKTYGEAAGWLDEMERRSIQPDVTTFNTLMARMPSYEVGVALLESMAEWGVAPNNETITPLIGRAPSYDVATGWLERMEAMGVAPNSEVFRSLVSASPDYPTAVGWLAEIAEHGATANTEVYRTLIALAPDYATAASLVERMIDEEVTLTAETIRSLLARVPDAETARTLLDRVPELGVRLTADIYLPLLTTAADFAEASAWVDHMAATGVGETAETLTALMRKADTYDQAERLLDEVRAKVEPGEAAYKVLVELSPDLLTAQGWVEEMREEGMRPGAAVLAVVLSKEPEGVSGQDLLDWYLSLEDRPSGPMGIAIDGYRRRGLVVDALRLALDYPHLDAARVLFAEHPEETREYLGELLDRQPGHANGRYAMGLALMAVGAAEEALTHLGMAKELARPGPRVAALEEIMRSVRATL